MADMLDVAIIGSGPSALAAALYLARAGVSVAAFERGAMGGELSRIAEISNYPGFAGPGQDLFGVMRNQAESAGAKILYGECTAVLPRDGYFELQIDDETVKARSVLAASGSVPKSLNFSITPPVSTCALCDGVLAKGKDIAIVGGANSAVQAALYLAPLAKSITLITHSRLKADQKLQQELQQYQNITIQENVEPTTELLNQYEYVFVFIGTQPASGYLAAVHAELGGILNKKGEILIGQDPDCPHQTKLPGLFAAGDVRADAIKQVVTAAGDGAAAAIEIVNYLRTVEK